MIVMLTIILCLFQYLQFGEVTAVVISVKKNGLAIVEYAKPSHAVSIVFSWV